VPSYPLEKLNALARTFDLFTPDARDWTPLLAQGLYPPLPVTERELVWGFPVLAAAERFELKEIACVELDPADPAALLAVALRLENRRGAYGVEEQARLYAFMAAAGLADETEKIAELTGLITAQQPSAWIREMGGYAALPEAIRRSVAQNVLDLKTAARVRSLPPGVFERLEREKGRLSFSDRRRFVFIIWEISCRDHLEPDAVSALANEFLSEGDPWPRLLALRYPEYTGLELRFAGIAAGPASEGITVRAPAGFEGDEFLFSFTATSRAVYGRRLAALTRFEEQVDRLFELL
jgi:hypothetical protein